MRLWRAESVSVAMFIGKKKGVGRGSCGREIYVTMLQALPYKINLFYL
jgi:hypothetical protein